MPEPLTRWRRTGDAMRQHREPIARLIGAALGAIIGGAVPSLLGAPDVAVVAGLSVVGVVVGASVPASW